ncbi:hypothetical protein ARMGADRAFT_1056361 [Armillaria gallica]|uniref:Uncharacterized protein n=1 Tax=Armillaria gallica TaxID=47427 RepID=A0A2H3EU83_ARMGA|nr:hypothetical protein ARMGADRAFT_1056361 [Armillaria gallica]
MFPRVKRFSAYSVSVDSYAIDERHERPYLDELCLYDSSTLLSAIPPSVFRGLRKLSIEGSISQDSTQRLLDVTRTTLRELCFVNLCLEQRGWGNHNGLDINHIQFLTLRILVDTGPLYLFTDLAWLENALSKMQGDGFLIELHIIFQIEDIHLLIVECIKHPRMTTLWVIMSRIAAAPRMASLRELRITLTTWKGPQEILLDETSYLEAWEEKLRFIFNEFSSTKAFEYIFTRMAPTQVVPLEKSGCRLLALPLLSSRSILLAGSQSVRPLIHDSIGLIVSSCSHAGRAYLYAESKYPKGGTCLERDRGSGQIDCVACDDIYVKLGTFP